MSKSIIEWHPVKWNSNGWEGYLPVNIRSNYITVLLTIRDWCSDELYVLFADYYISDRDFWSLEKIERLDNHNIVAWAYKPEPYEGGRA